MESESAHECALQANAQRETQLAKLCRSQEVSLTRMAAALVRGLHLAAALRARVHTAISLHALLGAPLNRSALRLLSHNLCLLKVVTHSYNRRLALSTLLWTFE